MALNESDPDFKRLAVALGFDGDGSATIEDVITAATAFRAYCKQVRDLLESAELTEGPESLELAGVEYVVLANDRYQRLIAKAVGTPP